MGSTGKQFFLKLDHYKVGPQTAERIFNLQCNICDGTEKRFALDCGMFYSLGITLGIVLIELGHTFCSGCLSKWMDIRTQDKLPSTCPTCKKLINRVNWRIVEPYQENQDCIKTFGPTINGLVRR